MALSSLATDANMMVFEQARKEAVLQSIADGFARKILLSTMLQEKSVEEISRENGIPISTCYRRVQELLSLRLLRIEHTIISDSGKKYERFKSAVSNATVTFSSGEISVELTPQYREPEKRLSSTWNWAHGAEIQIVSPVG